MTKTPEQLAIRYSDSREFADRRLDYKGKMLLEQGFLAGYQAAKDQLADASKVMNSPEKPDGWISVKERLPEDRQKVLAVVRGEIDYGYIKSIAYYDDYLEEDVQEFVAKLIMAI